MFKWFLDAGLTDKTPVTEWHKVFFLNRLILVCMVINIAIFVVDLILGVYINAFSNLALMVIYLPMYLLHHRGKYLLVRNVFLSIMTSFIVLMSIVTFHQDRWTETENIMFAVFAGVTSLYVGKMRVILSLLMASILVALKYYKFQYFGSSFDSDFTLTIVNTTATLVAIFFFMRVFQTEFYKTLGKITKLNEVLEEQSESLFKNEKRLKQLDKSRNKLLSIVIHDLKNPLNLLQGLMLLNDRDLGSPEERKSLSDKVNQSIHSINQMIDNVLVWAKSQLEGYELKNESLNIRQLLEDLRLFFQTQLDTKNLKLNQIINSETDIVVDKNLFQIVLRNIVSNAIKYSNQGGVINVISSQNSTELNLLIQDFGEGMDPKKVDIMLSGDFVNSTTGTEGETGTGLGLILSRELLQTNGCSLDVKSEINSGTEVTITAPLRT